MDSAYIQATSSSTKLMQSASNNSQTTSALNFRLCLNVIQPAIACMWLMGGGINNNNNNNSSSSSNDNNDDDEDNNGDDDDNNNNNILTCIEVDTHQAILESMKLRRTICQFQMNNKV